MKHDPPTDGLLEFGRVAVRGNAVHAVGEFDRCNVGLLQAALREVAEGSEGSFLVDLSEVTFLDSGAVAVLFEFAERAPRLRVLVNSVPARVLSVLGFGELGLLEVVAGRHPT
jgi:anti-anti-sigma factor